MMKVINRMQLRDQKGFTLVELLIVVAIIAILAAIAIPQYNEYRKNAAKKACLYDATERFRGCSNQLAADPDMTSCTTVATENVSSATFGPDTTTVTFTCLKTLAEGATVNCTKDAGCQLVGATP